jgi:cysteine desulfurase
MKRVRLDHNATTPMRPEARTLLVERLDRMQGNPSSVHASGREARAWLDEARERVAAALGVAEDEIVFTAGGTEAINLGLLGAMSARGPGAGLATTAIEHASVLGVLEQVRRTGRPAVTLPVDRAGLVDIEALIAADCAVLSVQAANSEIGTLQPLDEIAARLADTKLAEGKLAERGQSRPIFHTDAVQALGRIPVRLSAWSADLAAFSAHKVGGPLGVGVLYHRKGVALAPRLHGGGQEAGLRPGTENVPAISAAALAIELAVREQKDFAARTQRLSRSFWEQLRAVLPGVELNGPPIGTQDDPGRRLPNTIHFTFPEASLGAHRDGRVLIARLDLEGLEVSAGSACASGSLEPSHVLLALGHDRERARRGVRVSLGRDSDEEDVHTAVDILRRTFLALR